MIDSFPNDTRKEFIYKRVFFLRITFTFFTVLMGFILDGTGKSYAGFVIVFLTSIVLSLVDVFVLGQVKEPVVILKAGVYNPEIKEDILENINPAVTFLE